MLLPPVTEKVNVPAAAGVPIAVKVTALVPVCVKFPDATKVTPFTVLLATVYIPVPVTMASTVAVLVPFIGVPGVKVPEVEKLAQALPAPAMVNVAFKLPPEGIIVYIKLHLVERLSVATSAVTIPGWAGMPKTRKVNV